MLHRVSVSVPPPGHVPPAGAVAPAPAPAPVLARSPGRALPKLIAGALALAGVVVAAFMLLANQAVDPIAQAATVSSNSPGYRMRLSVIMTASPLTAPISATGSAVVDSPDHAASMSLSMQVPQSEQSLGTSTLHIAMVLEGADLYIKLPASLTSLLPMLNGKPWLMVTMTKAAGVPGVQSLSDDPAVSDPALTLRELRAGAQSITDEGQQVIDGVQTTHYHAEVDLQRLLSTLPSSVLERLTQGEGIPVDVWIDAQHRVRRVLESITLGAPNGPLLQETATTDITDYGRQPRPTPPPADQVTTAGGTATLTS
jgi:hypothetical protein